MSSSIHRLLEGFIIGVSFTLIIYIKFILPMTYDGGYKNGQIDCVKNKISYEMKVIVDSVFVEKEVEE